MINKNIKDFNEYFLKVLNEKNYYKDTFDEKDINRLHRAFTYFLMRKLYSAFPFSISFFGLFVIKSKTIKNIESFNIRGQYNRKRWLTERKVHQIAKVVGNAFKYNKESYNRIVKKNPKLRVFGDPEYDPDNSFYIERLKRNRDYHRYGSREPQKEDKRNISDVLDIS